MCRRCRQYLLSGRDRTREGDLIDACVACEQIASRRAGAGNEIDLARRQTYLAADFYELVSRRWRFFRRLDDDRATRGERRRHAAGDQLKRIVPGNDMQADADRLADGPVHPAVAERDRRALQLVRGAAVEFKIARGAIDFPISIAQRLAAVAAFHARQLFAPLHDALADALHDAAALERTHLAPWSMLERMPCGSDRLVGFRCASACECRDHLPGCRIVHRKEAVATLENIFVTANDRDFGKILGHGFLMLDAPGSCNFPRSCIHIG